MTCYNGSDGVVKAAGAAVGRITEFSVEETMEVRDCTAMGDVYKVSKPGRKEWSGSLTCHLEKSDVGQAALAVGAEVSLVLYPGGDATGEVELSGTALITKRGTSVSDGETVTEAFDFAGVGALTRGLVA